MKRVTFKAFTTEALIEWTGYETAINGYEEYSFVVNRPLTKYWPNQKASDPWEVGEGWIVTELSTGREVTKWPQATRTEAITHAAQRMNALDKERIKAIIAENRIPECVA